MRTLTASCLAAALLVAGAERAGAAPGDATYAAIATAIKSSFANAPSGKARTKAEIDTLVVDEIKRAYQSLGLTDKTGQLAIEKLKNKQLETAFDPAAFVDEVIGCAKKNTYLGAVMEAFGKATNLTYAKEWEKKRQWIVSATVYTKALDRLVKLVRNDITVLAAIRDHYRRAWENDQAFQKAYGEALGITRNKSNIFFRVKLASVDPAMSNFIEFIRDGKVPPTDGRFLLALNIAEASVADFAVSHPDNASAGLILAEHRVGADKVNPATKGGPTVLSADKKAILYSPPLPKQWADLYQTWNMAFVSQASTSPFLFAKLFTPQVACYEATPAEYVFNRAIALYLHLHFSMYRLVDTEFPKLGEVAKRPPVQPLDWTDEAMTLLWGTTNLASAKSYAQDVECRTPGFFAEAKSTFLQSVDQIGNWFKSTPPAPTAGANQGAQATALVKELDQKVKEQGNKLQPQPSTTCKVNK